MILSPFLRRHLCVTSGLIWPRCPGGLWRQRVTTAQTRMTMTTFCGQLCLWCTTCHSTEWNFQTKSHPKNWNRCEFFFFFQRGEWICPHVCLKSPGSLIDLFLHHWVQDEDAMGRIWVHVWGKSSSGGRMGKTAGHPEQIQLYQETIIGLRIA